MATYYGTYGQKVQYLASDPSDPQLGQVWYNSTSAVLKVRQEVTVNAWASGGNLPTATAFAQAGGTQNSTVLNGGYAPAATNTTQLYNGTSWTTSPATSSNIRAEGGGAGSSQTSAIVFGGQNSGPDVFVIGSEKFNGSSWTSGGNMNTGRWEITGGGTETATLTAGGASPSSNFMTSVESYNGTSWSTSPASLSTARRGGATTGTTNTANIVCGGRTAPATFTAATESYNGTSWTATGNLISARANLSGAGPQTASIVFGGFDASGPTRSNATEFYNGTSWSTYPNMATSASGRSGTGTQTAALASGGATPSNTANTEEWTGVQIQTKTVTVS